MKKFKRFLAVMLTAVMLITAAPLTGFSLSEEESLGYLTYKITDGKVTITSCDITVSGELVIPSEIDGYPVTKIGYDAFFERTGLTSITIPESVESIDCTAFRKCTSLKELNYNAISARTEYLYDPCSPFENLTSIETVKIGEKVLSLPSGFLYGCTGLKNITIPENVTYIGEAAFKNCTSLKELNYNAISASVGRYGYYDSSSPFEGLKSIERVTIGENVTSLPDGFLRGCTGFNNINIPDSVTSIGDEAFYDCTGLTSLTIPESIIQIGYKAFGNCSSLKEMIYNAKSASFEYGESSAPFSGLISLEKVTIGETVELLPNSFLYCCTELKSIKIPDSVTSIGGFAFDGCVGLTNIEIPENVTFIGDRAFSSCKGTVYYYAVNCQHAESAFISSKVDSVIISDKAQSLPERIFVNCDELTEITIPASVKSIGDGAFAECDKLTYIFFESEDEIELINEPFSKSYNAKICCKENSFLHFYAEKMGLNYCILNENNDPTFTIKNDVLISYSGNYENLFFGSASKIGFGAFKDNTDLKSVELSSNVTRIYNQAFKNCTELEKIIIPQSVASIGEDAFAGCDKLTVWCYAGSFAEAYAVNHEIPIKYITLNLSQDEVNLTQYETATLCASFNIDLSDNADMVWTSDNPSVVTVTSGGKITAVGVGEAVITATSANGLYAKCIVKVSKVEPKGSIKSVSLDDVEMKYKDTKQLYPIIEADDGVDYTVTYTSSDNSVARVDESGNVYAAKRGSADITVTVSDGFGNTITDTCSVKVNYSFWQWVIKILLFGWIWY